MNKHVALVLRWVGFKRPPPKTRWQRNLRHGERIILALLLLYGGLRLWPQILFAHSVSANGITIYSRTPLPPAAVECANQAAALVRQSELAVAGRHERVFVCNSPFVFRLFSPVAGGFAYSIPFLDHVFVREVDFPRAVARCAATEFNTRSAPAVIAHEIAHGLIRHRLGVLRARRLSDWVSEGYCEYVAREGSFPEQQGLRLFNAGQSDASVSYRYFMHRLLVRHLIEDQHLSFSQVVGRANDFAAVAAEARRAERPQGLTVTPADSRPRILQVGLVLDSPAADAIQMAFPQEARGGHNTNEVLAVRIVPGLDETNLEKDQRIFQGRGDVVPIEVTI